MTVSADAVPAGRKRSMLIIQVQILSIPLVFFVYCSNFRDIRLWVGPRAEHLLSSWNLTP